MIPIVAEHGAELEVLCQRYSVARLERDETYEEIWFGQLR